MVAAVARPEVCESPPAPSPSSTFNSPLVEDFIELLVLVQGKVENVLFS
jgi:hypothetical protein